MKVAIIGAGLIGQKRAAVFNNIKADRLVSIADLNEASAKNLAQQYHAKAFNNIDSLLKDSDFNIAIVSTINNNLAPLSQKLLQSGKHVLCEKPLGINSQEILRCVHTAKKKHLIYKAGYNHRYHPAIKRAFQIFRKGSIGKLMYIKSSYGHGGRPGYEKEWRAKQELSGGGELLDQGCHLLDLILWFTQDTPKKVTGSIKTHFWPISPLEDNAFIVLEFKDAVASFHTSWTLWKNEFIFEVYGTTGYLKVHGLGGSYGTETLLFGGRVPGKAPTEKAWQFTGPDDSWELEWQNFKQSIKAPNKLLSSGEESLEVIKIIERIYQTK